jgi:ribosome-binding protein aMBF1 (putative translation factor)
MARRKPAGTLSDQLRKRIAQDGRSLPELAQAAGINRVVLWRFARGRCTMNLKTADRLAAVLGVRLADDR